MINNFTLKQFMDLIDKNEKYCVWAKSHSTESYARELIKEINELLEGIKNNDPVNVNEEMADILWDFFVLTKIAEREYQFSLAKGMEDTIKKMQRRKPHIFEERKVTMEESSRLWKEAKEKEKQK